MLNNILDIFKYNSSSEIKEYNSVHSKTMLWVLKLLFTSTKRMKFYEQLSALLKNGISRHDALSLMRTAFTEHKTFLQSSWLELQILDDMIYRISCGLGSQSLAELLYGLVPQSDLTILSVDSKKGTALDQVVYIITKFGKLKSEVAKMFVTPVIALFLIIVGIYAANAYMFPVLINIKPVNQFPELTKALYNFCQFFGDNLGSFAIIAIIIIVAIICSLSRLTSPVRKHLDKIPPYSIYKRIQATSFLISLSMLLQADLDFDSAIEKILKNSSKYLKSYLLNISDNIELGLRPGKAVATVNLFSKSTHIYIEILDSANALATGMTILTDRSIILQLNSIKTLMIIISTVLIALSMLMGLLFLFSIASFSFSF
jgi:toxin co-regulated pilus biosynthesis protein E